MVPALCGSMTRVELMRAAAVNRFVVLLIVALAIPMAALAKNAKDIQKDEQQLHADARQLNADAARAASAPDGQRRLGERLAKQFNVDQSIVTDLRNRHFSYAQATITLALSKQLRQQDKTLSQQASLEKIIAERQAGKGWGVIARTLDLKLSHVISEVKKADTTAAHMARKPDTVDQNVAKIDKPDKAEKPDKLGR